MRIAVSATGPSVDATIDPRFGRCPHFIIIDTETMQYEAVQNISQYASHGAGIQAAQTIVAKGAKVVLTGNVGPNAFQALSAAEIQIVTGATGTVKDAVMSFKKGDLKMTDSPTVSGHSGMGVRNGMKRGSR